MIANPKHPDFPSQSLTVVGINMKKSSGRLLATNCGNIVARSKFLVSSLYNVNDAAHSVGAFSTKRSRRAEKFMLVRKIARNLLEVLSNTSWNNIFETYLGYWGCVIVLANLSWNFITTMSKQRPKTTKRKYVAKHWALVMMLKALPLAHFSCTLFLK